MPAPLIPPLPVPFNGSINALSVAKSAGPREGNKSIPININWGFDAGQNYSVSVSLQSQQIVTISEIKTLYVNNVSNLFDVSIFFQDTQQYINVPAGSQGYYPVVTGLLQFTAFLTDSLRLEQIYGLGGTGVIGGLTTPEAATLITVLNFYTDITIPDNKPELLGRTFLNAASQFVSIPVFAAGTTTANFTTLANPVPILVSDLHISISGALGAGNAIGVQISDFGGASVVIQEIVNNASSGTLQLQNVLYEGHAMFLPLQGLVGIVNATGTSAFFLSVNISVIYGRTVCNRLTPAPQDGI
jgi:hypothetical protein